MQLFTSLSNAQYLVREKLTSQYQEGVNQFRSLPSLSLIKRRLMQAKFPLMPRLDMKGSSEDLARDAVKNIEIEFRLIYFWS